MAEKKKKAAAKKEVAKKVLKKTATKTSKKTKGEEKPKKKKRIPQTVRGMKDILPQDGKLWRHMRAVADSITNAYNFEFVETPIVEEALLFSRTIGRSTDIVSKEMYAFEDKDGSKLALRPEGTASIVRSYLNNGMLTLPQPVSMWYYGPMFRHERPQSGRYRQFHQFGCEIIGNKDAVADAQLIVMGYNFYKDLQIETNVLINSIGTPDDRERYIVELVGYLRSKRSYLSEESRKKISKNPLRILDSKDPQDQEVVAEAPQIIDWLSEKSKTYFMKVLEYLDELDIPYVLKPTLVRGLDYYTDTVFEFVDANNTVKGLGSLGGGGRYNLLIEQLGGEPTPASGMAVGLDRVALILKKKIEKGEFTPDTGKLKLYFAHLGEPAKRRALYLIEELRRAGIAVNHHLGKPSLKAQLEQANKAEVSHALILGQKEMQDDTIIIRDMSSGIQEMVDQKKIVREIEKLQKNM